MFGNVRSGGNNWKLVACVRTLCVTCVPEDLQQDKANKRNVAARVFGAYKPTHIVAHVSFKQTF
jgi:hypothetical protein